MNQHQACLEKIGGAPTAERAYQQWSGAHCKSHYQAVKRQSHSVDAGKLSRSGPLLEQQRT
jgi:hypothetical protein